MYLVTISANPESTDWKCSQTYIHVQPQVVLLADVGNVIDGIECSIYCGTSRRIHKQWHVTLK